MPSPPLRVERPPVAQPVPTEPVAAAEPSAESTPEPAVESTPEPAVEPASELAAPAAETPEPEPVVPPAAEPAAAAVVDLAGGLDAALDIEGDA